MNRARVGLLWLVLVLLFVAFYQFFNHATRSSEPPNMLAILPILFVVLFGVFFAVFYTRARKGIGLANQALALSQQGRYLAALELLEKARRYFTRRNMLAYHRGVMRLALWQVADAELDLRQGVQMKALNLRMLAVPQLALANALLGRVESARTELSECARLDNAGAPEAIVAEAVLACRAGSWSEAAAALSRPELRNLGGPTRGLADALRCWSDQQLARPSGQPDVVAVLGEAGMENVRSVWPELAAFLERAAAAPGQPAV